MDLPNNTNNIRYIRHQSLMSQEDFAQALGVAFTTVNRWETGKCKPNYKTMKLIDEFCRDNTDDIVIWGGKCQMVNI